MARGVHIARGMWVPADSITSVDYSPGALIRARQRGKTSGHARFKDNLPGSRPDSPPAWRA
jgi:hypothetical protein